MVAPVRPFPQNPTGPTRGDLRREGWRRSSWGLWVPPGVDGSLVEQRIVEAAANLGAFGGVTGWAALAWLGSRWCTGVAADGVTELPVVLAADKMRRPANALLSEERVNPLDLLEVDGVVITLPERSVTFEMRYATSVREAVVWFEMAAYDDLVSIEEAWAYTAGLNGWTGVPQLRQALLLVVENSWSPQETRLRLVWVIDAALPAPLCNRPVFDLDANHLGTPDLLDVEAGVVVQYDGPDHLDPQQQGRDEAQDFVYSAHGLTVVRVDRHDLQDRLRLASRLRAVREEALTRQPRRDWTVEVPGWWVPTFTVAQRRALDAETQARWLRYRTAS